MRFENLNFASFYLHLKFVKLNSKFVDINLKFENSQLNLTKSENSNFECLIKSANVRM